MIFNHRLYCFATKTLQFSVISLFNPCFKIAERKIVKKNKEERKKKKEKYYQWRISRSLINTDETSYKLITVVSMPSELLAIWNYAVSNLIFRRHYNSAVT